MKSLIETPAEGSRKIIKHTQIIACPETVLSGIHESGQNHRGSSPLLSFFILIFFLIPFSLPIHGQIIYPFEKPILIHYPVEDLKDLRYREIVLLIEGRKTGLQSVSIFLKKDADIYFKEFPMTYKDGVWKFHLDRRFLDTSEIEYFFTAEFSDNRILALPEKSPDKSPFKLRIRNK